MNTEKTLQALESLLSRATTEERIEISNRIKSSLSENGRFHCHPVDCVQWVKMDTFKKSSLQPGRMSPAEMNALRLSILKNGFTQPLLVYSLSEENIIIDGFSRFYLAANTPEIQSINHGYLPVVKLHPQNTTLPDITGASVRHNRARGSQKIEEMIEAVTLLSNQGWHLNKISEELGVEPEEVLRLKQMTGLMTLFEAEEYSEAWTVG